MSDKSANEPDARSGWCSGYTTRHAACTWDRCACDCHEVGP